MSNTITHISLSEEISAARSSIDHTLVLLRAQLNSLSEKCRQSAEDLQSKGEMVDLKSLGCVQEQGIAIDNLISRLNQQRLYLEQAYAYVKLVQKSL
jgi:hypothetical protein